MLGIIPDASCAMPRSIGTLEEIAGVMVWTQLGLQRKACGVLNVNGYYDHLIAMIGKMVDGGFLHTKHGGALVVAAEPAEMVERLVNAEVRYRDKWLHGAERR